MSKQWQKDLTVAARAGVHKVLGLWQCWEKEGTSPGAALELAAVLVRMLRFPEAIQILETLGCDLPVQQQRALVLAKMGRLDDAIEILEGLRADGHNDAETRGILAGRYKQRALATGGDTVDLQTAYQLYADAYEDTKDAYPGINAASLALEEGVGEPEESARIANEIVERLEQMPRAEMDHWQFATLGEAYLLLRRLDEAKRWYRRAVAANPNAAENIATMRRQARRNLERLGEPGDALDKLLAVKRVIAFTGHMLDRPARAEPRFPVDKIRDVRLAIRERLSAHGAGFGVSSAAAGSDLLFLEELLDRGGAAEVILPFPEEDFIQTSVHDWEGRFRKALADPRVTVTVLHGQRPTEEGLEAAFQECNVRIMERAQEIAAALDEVPELLAVWDGKPGDGRGGTADAVKWWRGEGLSVDVIPLSGGASSATDRTSSVAPVTRSPTRNLVVGDPAEAKAGSLPKRGAYAARYCLAIGVEAYDGAPWQPLANTRRDAEEVGRVLADLYGFETTSLINADATKERIAETVEDDFGRTVKEDDLVVLFFAGHGHTVHKKGQEHGYIVPFGASEDKTSKLISMDTLVSWSTFIEARHILYVFDSCFSGILALGAGGARTAQDPQAAAISICAGTAEQPVLDGGGDGHSVFTHHLLQALREDVDKDGKLTATKLYSYVRERVLKVAPQQTPTLGQLPNHQGGEIELERIV